MMNFNIFKKINKREKKLRRKRGKGIRKIAKSRDFEDYKSDHSKRILELVNTAETCDGSLKAKPMASKKGRHFKFGEKLATSGGVSRARRVSFSDPNEEDSDDGQFVNMVNAESLASIIDEKRFFDEFAAMEIDGPSENLPLALNSGALHNVMPPNSFLGSESARINCDASALRNAINVGNPAGNDEGYFGSFESQYGFFDHSGDVNHDHLYYDSISNGSQNAGLQGNENNDGDFVNAGSFDRNHNLVYTIREALEAMFE